MAISPEMPEHQSQMIIDRKLTLPILFDGGGDYSERLGLRFELPEDLRPIYDSFGINLPKANGDGDWRLPMPARYLVDREGVVRYARVHADYTRRPEAEDTLEALRAL